MKKLTNANTPLRWASIIAVPLVACAAGLAYGAIKADHRRRLGAALSGPRTDIQAAGHRLCLYGGGTGQGTPLLLVHSINAAASSYEMRPLYLHYAKMRPTYALDLPGFGLSDRNRQTYTTRIMADAIGEAVRHIRSEHGGAAIDLMALSISCEFAARVALERSDDVRSLGLVSPTGFDKALSGYGRAQSTKGNGLKLALVSLPVWSQALFDLVVSRPSMRFFLEKTFGSNTIDEGLFEYDQASAHQPGAMHVVWSFLSGFLFADDVTRVYKALHLPVWSVHGRRGDFVDYGRQFEVADRTNWTFDVFDTGAMPQFERLEEMVRSYDAFTEILDRS